MNFKLLKKLFFILFLLSNDKFSGVQINNIINNFWNSKKKIFKLLISKLYTMIFLPNMPPINYYNEREELLLEYLNEQNKTDNNFVNIYNKLHKKNKGVNDFFTKSIKTLFELLKIHFIKEKNYRDEKKTVYKLYFRNTSDNNIDLHQLNSSLDFNRILDEKKSSLIFNQQQKNEIIKIISEMNQNIFNRKKDNSDRHTTQIFLSGPPGTGKTQLAYLISDLTGLPMVILSTSKLLLQGYQSIRMIQEILDEVRTSGAILYIDEAELLFMNRDNLINLTNTSYSENKNFSEDRVEFSEILHKLLTTFLSETGNQKHNIIISSNKIDIFDSAMRRRIKYFLYLNLPTNEILYKIALKYIEEYKIIFSDLSIEEAAGIIIDYNSKLNKLNENKKGFIGLSGSDIKVIISSLKDEGRILKKKNFNYFQTNKNQLINSINNRLNVYSLFGWSINMNNSGDVSFDEVKIEGEFEKHQKIKAQKALELQFKLNEKNRNDIYKIIWKNKKPEIYYFPTNIFQKNSYKKNIFKIINIFFLSLNRFTQGSISYFNKTSKKHSITILNNMMKEFNNKDQLFIIKNIHYRSFQQKLLNGLYEENLLASQNKIKNNSELFIKPTRFKKNQKSSLEILDEIDLTLDNIDNSYIDYIY
jgi:hypothetical protein